jgi:hypothetical protein
MPEICIKCLAEATFDSPENYCDYHWTKWWVDGMNPETQEQREVMMHEGLEEIRRLHGRVVSPIHENIMGP